MAEFGGKKAESVGVDGDVGWRSSCPRMDGDEVDEGFLEIANDCVYEVDSFSSAN